MDEAGGQDLVLYILTISNFYYLTPFQLASNEHVLVSRVILCMFDMQVQMRDVDQKRNATSSMDSRRS
jgi:hypothetical protein